MRNPKIYLAVGLLLLAILVFASLARDKKVKISDSEIRNIENVSEIISSYPTSKSEILGSMNEEIEHIMFFEAKDGVMKAAVPYRVENSKSPLNLVILTKEGNYWVESDKISLIGEDFDRIIFKDLTGDGCPEIVTGVKMGNTQTKGLVVHGYRGGDLVEFFSDSYDELIVADVIEDKSFEIIVGKYSPDGESLNIRAYKQTGGRIRLIDSVDVEGVAEDMSIDLVEVAPGKKAILIQGEIEGNRGYLEALELTGDEIKNMEFFGEETVMNPFFLEARDIDGDGTVEIPFIRESPGLDQSDKKTWVSEWYSLDESGKLSIIKKEYVDRRNEFTLEYLSSWSGKEITARLSEVDGMEEYVEFSTYEDDTSRKKLFGIEVYTEEEWSKKTRSYRRDRLILSKSQERVYVLDIDKDIDIRSRIEARSFAGVQESEKSKIDEIKSRFRTLDFGN